MTPTIVQLVKGRSCLVVELPHHDTKRIHINCSRHPPRPQKLWCHLQAVVVECRHRVREIVQHWWTKERSHSSFVLHRPLIWAPCQAALLSVQVQSQGYSAAAVVTVRRNWKCLSITVQWQGPARALEADIVSAWQSQATACNQIMHCGQGGHNGCCRSQPPRAHMAECST